MALLLLIDTATEYGAVAISENEKIIAIQENRDQKEHASFLHPAIKTVAASVGISLNHIDAIGVTIGPGSYTGLRVGLTAAKGVCYVLQKPLIAVNTLQAMAFASIENTVNINFVKPVLHAPMIDARRMEVYTGLYTNSGEMYCPPQALIIDTTIFAAASDDFIVVVSGSGSKKLKGLLYNDALHFVESSHSIKHVSDIAYKHFLNGTFENVAYCEPVYLKPFYTPGIVNNNKSKDIL